MCRINSYRLFHSQCRPLQIHQIVKIITATKDAGEVSRVLTKGQEIQTTVFDSLAQNVDTQGKSIAILVLKT